MTETFKPYEPENDPAYEYEYDDYPDDNRRGPNVLWGRIIALAVVLVVAFWLGRATAGGVDEAEVDDLRKRLNQTQEENADLQAQVDAAQEASQDEPDTEATPDAETTEAAEPETETYVVEKGDTLRGIAQTYCGDPDQDDLIAATNGIDDATQLSVGQELTIPAECTG